jgi:hypothetical protein
MRPEKSGLDGYARWNGSSTAGVSESFEQAMQKGNWRLFKIEHFDIRGLILLVFADAG